MEAFLIYGLKSAVILAVFYIFWRLLLRKETLHRLNRFVLLSTPALSLVLPLCVITVKTGTQLAQKATEAFTPITHMPEAQPSAEIVSNGPAWWTWLLLAIWAGGVVLVLANTVISVIKVTSIIRKGKKERFPDGTEVTVVEGDIAPFSWMGDIVIDRQDFEEGHSEIILHEKAHIALKHSWDILFTDLLTAFQWFNPTVWMLRSDLRELHEYQADEHVLEEGVDMTRYQYLLIRKAAGAIGYTVANSFNHTTLKNRFTMMLRKRSSSGAILKALYILPLAVLSLSLNAQTQRYYEHALDGEKDDARLQPIIVVGYGETQQEESADEEVQFTLVPKLEMPGDAVNANDVDVLPKFKENDHPEEEAGAFERWLNQKLYYPEKSKKDGTKGLIYVTFCVDKKGKVTDVDTPRHDGSELEALVKKLVESSPDWIPGQKDGKKVKTWFYMDIFFELR